MVDCNRWKERVLRDIEEISDLNLQYKVWVIGEGDIVSSFDEALCMLFDSDCFEDFILECRAILDNRLIEKLNYFKEELNNYSSKISKEVDNFNRKIKTDAEIINDPNWIKISALAKDIIEYWGNVDNRS